MLGIACYFEGAQGFEMLDGNENEIAVQFVPLTRDGCSNTDVEIEKVIKAIYLGSCKEPLKEKR